MTHLSARTLLLASTAIALPLASAPLAAAPAPAPFSMDADVPAAAPMRSGTRLAHLPADRELLMLRGERARRRYTVDLPHGAAERAMVFQLAFKNTVTLLPERSSLEVFINGRPLAVVQPRSAEAVAVLPVAIPPGLVSGGANEVEIVATMAHRVDCSVAATYELWTAIDAARTGFVLPEPDFGAVRGLRDVALEPLAADGTLHIVLRSPSMSDEAAMSRAGRFIGALVARTGLARPAVDLGPRPADEPGIDVVLASGAEADLVLDSLREVGREDGITIARSAATGRLAVVLAAADEAALEAKLAHFVGGVPKVPPGQPGEVAAGSRHPFADFGLRTESFTGRHYTASLDVALPSDALTVDHQNARLLLDGVYAGNLDADSSLAFRVNGVLASTLSLASDRGGAFQHRAVDLPIRHFHPGHNEIAIDATLPAASDRQCDASSLSTAPRLVLSNTSELEIPRFTRLATAPQLPGAVTRIGLTGEPVPVYLPDADGGTVSAALDLLANMAAQGHPVLRPALHVGPIAEDARPGIAVAPWSALPSRLSHQLRAEVVAGAGAPVPAAEAAPGGSWASRAGDLIGNLADRAASLLSRQGFTYGVKTEARPLSLTSRSFLLASTVEGARSPGAPGIEVPRFTADGRQWLIATASGGADIRTGLDQMTAGGRWRDLEGQAMSLDTGDGTFTSTQPSRVSYGLPDRLNLTDVRPVLGSILSSNIAFSLGLLVLLMAVLGVSTHALIRRTRGD